MNKSLRILEFVGQAKEEGRSFSEIQRFICEIRGLDWDLFNEPGHFDPDVKRWVRTEQHGPGPGLRRKHRGIDCCNLMGFLPWRGGILTSWCVRNAKGRWVLIDWPGQEPSTRRTDTRAFKINCAINEAKSLTRRGRW